MPSARTPLTDAPAATHAVDLSTLSAYDYPLPADRIAQRPTAARRDARLMTLPRRGALDVSHHHIATLPQLLRGDELLVFNDARVVPARLHGVKTATGGAVELLALSPHTAGAGPFDAQVKTGKTLKPGTTITLSAPGPATAATPAAAPRLEVVANLGGGRYRLRLDGDQPASPTAVLDLLHAFGALPLPPYIDRPSGPGAADDDRYQTTFAAAPGAIAAPTAGLHFDAALLDAIAARGCDLAFVTLYVGLGTFLPVRTERLADHAMHREAYAVPEATADAIADAKRRGRPVLAVGTTVVRTLEGAAGQADGIVPPGAGSTDLFIRPGRDFAVVDQLLTNFHLPKSTLLVLVSAFAGRDRVLAAYREAIAQGYRFFSYGDAMLLR